MFFRLYTSSALAVVIPLWLAVSVSAQPTERPESNPLHRVPDDSLVSVLPQTVNGWTRGEIDTASGSLPTGPQSRASGLRALLPFIPEVLMEIELPRDRLSGVRITYEGGPQPMYVGVIDYGSIPTRLRSSYLQGARDGHARSRSVAIGNEEGLVLEGTGTSDDVVPPHGVKAVVGGRFEVVIFEKPPEGVSSVKDFQSLSSNELETIVGRARQVLNAVDLETLSSFASKTE